MARFRFGSEKLNLLLSALAVSVAIISFYYQFRDRSPELTLQFDSCEKLAPLDTDASLEAEYKFMGRPVELLWRYVFTVSNTGGATVVGEGTHSDLIADKLNLEFPEGFTLLRLQQVRTDLEIEHQTRGSELWLRFQQWKVGESATYAAYFTSDQPDTNVPAVRPAGRDLVDGTFVVKETAEGGGKHFLRDLPRPFVGTIRVMNYIFVVLCVAILMIVAVGIVVAWIKAGLWKRRNKSEFEQFVAALAKSDPTVLVRPLLDHPYDLPRKYEGKWQGEKLPDDPLFRKGLSMVVGVVLCLGFAVAITLVALGA